MPRISKFTQVVHSLSFTPHQLQPADILRWSADAFCHTALTQLKSQPELIEDHRFGFVYVGWQVKFLRPFTLHQARGEAARLNVESGLTAHTGKRDLMRVRTRFFGGGQEIVLSETLLNPLKMSGGAALDGVPSGLPDDIRAMLQPDELDASPPPNLFDANAVTESGELLRDRKTPFVLYRHEGELADMWQNPCLASLDGRAREAMVFDGGDDRLKHGLSKPIATMSAQLRRPVYVHEEGVILTRAYWLADHVAYVHEVKGSARGGSDSDRPTCATIVVHMAP